MNKKIKKELERIFKKSRVLFNEPMRKHTSMRIGGPADVFIIVEDAQELKKILGFARKKSIPLFTVGGGTNLLVGDKGIRGIVLKLGKSFGWIKFKRNKVIAGSSIPIAKLLEEVARHSLSGLECMAGIPGTLGGAVVANAGVPEKAVGDFVSSAKLILLNGKIVTIKKNNLRFSYRASNLKNQKGIILEVTLGNLQKKSRVSIERQLAFFEKKKWEKQPRGFPSAGCIFKNPSMVSAGTLIDFAKMKGLSIGGAEISRKHANFILNVSLARAVDVVRLIRKMSNKIYKLFRIKLELEIEKAGIF